jgi:hypothetical protein
MFNVLLMPQFIFCDKLFLYVVLQKHLCRGWLRFGRKHRNARPIAQLMVHVISLVCRPHPPPPLNSPSWPSHRLPHPLPSCRPCSGGINTVPPGHGYRPSFWDPNNPNPNSGHVHWSSPTFSRWARCLPHSPLRALLPCTQRRRWARWEDQTPELVFSAPINNRVHKCVSSSEFVSWTRIHKIFILVQAPPWR